MPQPPALARANAGKQMTGRPKGSRNKITLIKLMAEEAVRDKNLSKMLKVCGDIIDDALAGDEACRKLVWQSVMSKSGVDPSTSSEAAPTIIVRTDAPVTLQAAAAAPDFLESTAIDVTPKTTKDTKPNG
jgi:hypothetical protein